MRTITFYEADDGTRFDNEFDCVTYELRCKLKNTDIRIYKERFRLRDLLADKTHNECTRVVVPNENALNDMRAIQNYSGYYCDIDSVGTWKYDDNKQRWVRKEN